MRLVDANVLLYAVNPAAEQHAKAQAWLDRALSADDSVAFAWTVLLAFIRLATSPAVFPRPLSATEALGSVRSWVSQPAAVILEPSNRHLDVLAGLLTDRGTAGNIVSDAHLAALAVEHDATLVSFDADFSSFRGVRWGRPA